MVGSGLGWHALSLLDLDSYSFVVALLSMFLFHTPRLGVVLLDMVDLQHSLMDLLWLPVTWQSGMRRLIHAACGVARDVK